VVWQFADLKTLHGVARLGNHLQTQKAGLIARLLFSLLFVFVTQRRFGQKLSKTQSGRYKTRRYGKKRKF
jgi:hypothetical protein